MYQPPPNARPLNLDSARSKIKWAKKHIADLSKERVGFLGANRYYGVPKFDAETNRTDFILKEVPDIPREIRLLLGDAAHNLRTALDYLASELVRSMGIEPKGIYFPICETVEKYEAESNGKTQGMPEAAKKLIDRLCPYGGGNNLLWGLHQLDIIDKHRLPLTTTMKVGSWSVTLDQTARAYNFAFVSALKAGDVIGDLEGNHESDKQMSITADIAFGEPDVFAGDALFPMLTILADYVEWIILEFGG